MGIGRITLKTMKTREQAMTSKITVTGPSGDQENWEEAFDDEFYEGLHGIAESTGEFYDQDEAVKAFIRRLRQADKERIEVLERLRRRDALEGKTGYVLGSYDLKEPPSMQRLDQFFYELFMECDADPEYLFLAKQDHEALSKEIARNTNIRCRPEDVPRMLNDLKTHYINATTGKLVNMAPLSFLEPNHIIFVFFR
jgi:Arc/MetJ-type ribon-helix-helix transcriptional regulator